MEDRESKVQSLDEYLGERGLSFPVSDFMLDKTRIPHGLTSRAEKRMHLFYKKLTYYVHRINPTNYVIISIQKNILLFY